MLWLHTKLPIVNHLVLEAIRQLMHIRTGSIILLSHKKPSF